jgi:hypothetical protein
MMFNAAFNNISIISWWSVLLIEETGVHGELTMTTAVATSQHGTQSIKTYNSNTQKTKKLTLIPLSSRIHLRSLPWLVQAFH